MESSYNTGSDYRGRLESSGSHGIQNPDEDHGGYMLNKSQGSRHNSQSYQLSGDEEDIEQYHINEDVELGPQPGVLQDDLENEENLPSKTKSNPLKKVTSIFQSKSKKKYTPDQDNSKPSKLHSMKRLFSRKDSQRPPVEATGIQPALEEGDVSLPNKAETTPPTSKDKSKLEEVKTFILHPPPRKMQSWVQESPDVAEMKPVKEKETLRISTLIWVLLICGFITGIIMSALSSKGEAMAVLGPTFICLSLLAMVGKLYFSLVFESEPFPRLTPYVEKFNEKFTQQKTKTPEKLMPWDERVRLTYEPQRDPIEASYTYQPTYPMDSDPSSSLPPGATAADIRHEREDSFQHFPQYDSDENGELPPGMISARATERNGHSQQNDVKPQEDGQLYDNYADFFNGDRDQDLRETPRNYYHDDQYSDSDSDHLEYLENLPPPPPGAGISYEGHYPSDL